MDTVFLHLLDIRSARGREPDILSLLPPARADKANRFIREDDRLLSLCAGYLLFRYVGGYTVDRFGKPKSDKCFFSLSHAGGLAAIAVGEKNELGLDLERKRTGPDTASLAGYCLSEEEKAAFPLDEDFLPAFVAKESLAKAEGRGLGKPVKAIPALPLNGAVLYENKTFYRHSFERNGYLFSVSQEEHDFTVETDEIEVDLCCLNNC